jgi:hypothetical protein
MRLVLGTFARRGIEACSGGDIAAGVRAALRHYTNEGGSRLKGAYRETPRFIRTSASSGKRPEAGVELSVDPDVQAALEREASQSAGVSVEQIATHAVLAYLADLDEVSTREVRPLTRA